jgi:hypothetical protein
MSSAAFERSLFFCVNILASISPTFSDQLLRQYSCAKKLQNQTVIREKLRTALLYKNPACKKFMILAAVVNFFNILRAAFAPIFYCQKITKPKCN